MAVEGGLLLQTFMFVHRLLTTSWFQSLLQRILIAPHAHMIRVHMKKKVKGILYFRGQKCFSKKEAFKYIRKARVLIIIGVAGLHNSYPRRLIPTDL